MRSGQTQRTWTGMLLATALLGLVGVGYGGNGEARPPQRQCPPGQAACVDVKGARGPCHEQAPRIDPATASALHRVFR